MGDQETDASKTERERLGLLYQFGLTYSATFNTLIIASVFGVFSILLLIQAGEKPIINGTEVSLPIDWVVYSISYLAAGLIALYLYARTLVYSRLTAITASRISKLSGSETGNDLFEEVYREACTGPGSNRMTRSIYRTYDQRGRGEARFLIPLGTILLIALWFAASF